MKLYNSLTQKLEDFKPLKNGEVTIYSCGPTVYDRIHIGNLSAFIYSDLLRRSLILSGHGNVHHVMNLTDVDDKTIRRCAEEYAELPAMDALQELTNKYAQIFFKDMEAVGNDVNAYDFTKATDYIIQMQDLIRELYNKGYAYIADDGIYFSITKYKSSGKKYGQLVEITESSTSEARIENDEYDKDNAHDFALWKKAKSGEPVWGFKIADQEISGRPGWHIECSAMSADKLGQPFDIHTGGVDLKFPHHENEIAQSTAGKNEFRLANYFIHNEHILVDGQKMSKSLNNFYTLEDIKSKGFEPEAFRVLVLQSHYRNQAHFSWNNLEAAQNRLNNWRQAMAMRWQQESSTQTSASEDISETEFEERLSEALSYDLDNIKALQLVDEVADRTAAGAVCQACLEEIIENIKKYLGIDISVENITEFQMQLIEEREKARQEKDWAKSDELRSKLKEQGIGLRDTDQGSLWFRL